jgi:hypothetical protein
MESNMKPSLERSRRGRALLLAGMVCVLLAGCTVAGPSAVRNGRLAYNRAITETNNQQILMAIVQSRYDEAASMLAVASVTANVTVTASTAIELGFGDSDNYRGGLVPFRAGAIYEENPTISYVPVAGAAYARQVFSPVPVSVLAELTGTMADPTYVFTALIDRANGVRNPDFLYASAGPDPRFERFVALMTTLIQVHRLHWIGDKQRQDAFAIMIDEYVPEFAAEARELLELLELPAPPADGGQVVVTVFLALDGHEAGGIGLATRSVGDLLEILAAAIEVPEEDLSRGIAATFPPAGPAGSKLRVRYSEDEPSGAAVAVPYRDGWFFIDETDRETKRFFRLVSALWSVIMAEGATHAATPVLTVPVSR